MSKLKVPVAKSVRSSLLESRYSQTAARQPVEMDKNPSKKRFYVRLSQKMGKSDMCLTCSGAEGIRTPGLLIANETRYQLRHSPLVEAD